MLFKRETIVPLKNNGAQKNNSKLSFYYFTVVLLLSNDCIVLLHSMVLYYALKVSFKRIYSHLRAYGLQFCNN